MVCSIPSLGLHGVSGYPVTAECDLSGGLPAFTIVGLPDAAVTEARERVRSAIKNCGFAFPVSRITVNLAPAHLKKVGTLLLALSIPLLLNLLPWLCEYAGLSLTPLIIWMRADVFHFVLLMVLLLVLTTLGGAGLLRRADICESRGA